MTALERVPGKIVAVHVSYRSRAAERGTMPAWPSYFLKPSSSLAESGDPVARPPGCELLAFEGEVALVIGPRARRVSRADGWDHVAWITAANDFGVYDLRYADRGSNVRSKGIDGFTPLGPRLIDARAVDLATVRLRTWVNGDLAQDAWPAQDLLFGFGDIVSDLSRLVTLEPGDVILTGTPAGSTVVNPGDVVEVEVSAGDQSSGRLRSPIVEADYRLDPPGAMPRADHASRSAAYGASRGAAYGASRGAAYGIRGEPANRSQAVLAGLREVSTATLAALLRKRGLNGLTLDGLRSTRPGTPMAGYARTVRYLPLREDLFAAHGGGMNAQKRAIEDIRPGEV
ncbi:MAG: fumarylacetoacetate hydrolase family protein, partial [Streptosporangiaceae bacterium]